MALMIEAVLLDMLVDASRREAAIDALGLPPENQDDPYAASTEAFVEMARSRCAETIPAPAECLGTPRCHGSPTIPHEHVPACPSYRPRDPS